MMEPSKEALKNSVLGKIALDIIANLRKENPGQNREDLIREITSSSGMTQLLTKIERVVEKKTLQVPAPDPAAKK